MIDPSRGARIRRGGRRPGWILMTVLLVLAIAASSALVFTNRVELLKLAVILALWAAVVASFVSVLYRRQSDTDAAKVRDQKLVYDLQLDREISARREYELAVESQLRRELASELRAQSADEVSALRAELAALRANLEFLFDTDLSHRHAIETDRNGGPTFSDWTPGTDSPAGRVSSSRIDAEDAEYAEDAVEVDAHTEESPIIDVPVEPHLPEDDGVPLVDGVRGAHRRFAEGGPDRSQRVEDVVERQWPSAPEAAPRTAPPPPPPPPQSAPPQLPWLPPAVPPPPPHAPAAAAENWQPAPAEGQWLPPGTPGSNWVSPPPGNGTPGEYVGRRRAGSSPPPPAPPEPPSEPPRGRHYGGPGDAPPPPPPSPPAEPEDEQDADGGAHTGGQSVAELLARLQSTPSGGGRRRRRED